MKSAVLATNIIRQKISYCRMVYLERHKRPTILNDIEIVDLYDRVPRNATRKSLARIMTLQENIFIRQFSHRRRP